VLGANPPADICRGIRRSRLSVRADDDLPFLALFMMVGLVEATPTLLETADLQEHRRVTLIPVTNSLAIRRVSLCGRTGDRCGSVLDCADGLGEGGGFNR
jgi:hypothetical protein